MDGSNRIYTARAAGRTAIGMSLKAPSARNVEAAARANLDFVRFDLSAKCIPPSALSGLVESARGHGLTALVRVASAEQIPAAFGDGAHGITAQSVTGCHEAEHISQLCIRHGAHLGEQLIVSVQIESLSALADAQKIASVEGIHMLQSGRNDLAKSMGLPGQPQHPDVLEAEERIAAAATGAGKLFSLHFAPGRDSVEQAQAWMLRGIPCLTIGADTQILDEAVRQRVAAITAAPRSTQPEESRR